MAKATGLETASITAISQLYVALQESLDEFSDEALAEISEVAQSVGKLAGKAFVNRLIARTLTD